MNGAGLLPALWIRAAYLLTCSAINPRCFPCLLLPCCCITQQMTSLCLPRYWWMTSLTRFILPMYLSKAVAFNPATEKIILYLLENTGSALSWGLPGTWMCLFMKLKEVTLWEGEKCVKLFTAIFWFAPYLLQLECELMVQLSKSTKLLSVHELTIFVFLSPFFPQVFKVIYSKCVK